MREVFSLFPLTFGLCLCTLFANYGKSFETTPVKIARDCLPGIQLLAEGFFKIAKLVKVN